MNSRQKRAAALVAIVGAFAAAGFCVWQPREASPASSPPTSAGEEAGTLATSLQTARGEQARAPVAATRADGLRLVLRSDEHCDQAELVHVTVATQSASESRLVRVGEPSSWPVSGVVRIEAGGFGWLPSSRVVDLEAAARGEVVLDVFPRTLLRGRILDALDRAPIEAFGLRVESTLEQPNGDTHTYLGSPDAIVSPDGSFCRLLLQEASSNRLTIDASGYEAQRTGWIAVNPGDPWDVGDVLLTPVVEHPLEVHVVDVVSGAPLEGAAVIVATVPFAAKDLILLDGRITLRFAERQPRAATTDADGVARLGLPVGQPLWIAAWREPYNVEFGEHAALAAAQPATLRMELTRGPRIEGVLRLGSQLASVVEKIHIEVLSDGERRQLPLELPRGHDKFPFVVEGLSAGPAELWVVARELGNERTLLATETLVLEESETLHLKLDCGLPFGEGVVQGYVTLPVGEDLVACRAFAVNDRSSAVANRSVPVRENRFVISDCAAPSTVLGIRGSDSSAAVLVLWIGEVRTGAPPLSIDLTRSVVHGHVGDLSQFAMEEVVVSPIGDHPFAGIPLAAVTAYPESDGEFTIYGLSPGSYHAVASHSQLEAEFQVGAGSVDVHLKQPR